MTAFHTISSAPHRAMTDNPFAMNAEDLYTAVISALKWRQKNGRIALYCDNAAYEFITQNHLAKIWDEVYNTLPDILDGLKPNMFWAAGKLFALRQCAAPCVMLDTDFIVWETLNLPDDGILCAHREDISDDVYPDPRNYNMRGGYAFPFNTPENLAVLPCNTAFALFTDNQFKEYYLDISFDFMRNAIVCDDGLTRMVTAEQRLLAMCAEAKGVPIRTLLDKNRLFLPQDGFTHLWGAKGALRANPVERKKFYARCKKRISTDFPNQYFAVKFIQSFEH